MTHDLDVLADRLAAAHAGGPPLPAALLQSLDLRDAYRLQDATLERLGPVGGWKVGSKGPDAQPHCAPLPLAALHRSGAMLPASRFAWRMVELEVAVRLRVDLSVGPADRPTPSELAHALDAVLPAFEAVESRLEDGQNAPPMAKLADLQCHGALVLGTPSSLAPADVDLRSVQATLWVGETCAVDAVGGNPAQDLWALLGWLARHCTERGMPLQQGQVVTTGSCTGLTAVPPACVARGALRGIGTVELQYDPAA